MAKKRRTQADRDRDRAEAEQRVWDRFWPRLQALETYEEAQRLVDETPPPDAPGRRFYSNLAFFLGGFAPPAGAGGQERSAYLAFIARLDAAGRLRAGARQEIEAAFARAAAW